MSNETPSTSSSPPAPVKKETEEEIKDFAETAMNELLGWYGYERLEFKRWAASRAKDPSSPEQASENKDKDVCSWCNKNITSENGALQQAGATFCSELCFSQSRRANFKRAKTCDWCRHVRHTVAYVDFQDGATQLQFCSDKCLNQYKMHIFCRETQAHLDLNPHLVQASSSSNLITPELWLKNCRSRSTSPHSERSISPVSENLTRNSQDKSENKKSPIITVASTAKLMNKSEERTSSLKSPDTKKDLKKKLNLRKRRTSKTATVTSQSLRHTSTPKAQDLRMCSPSTLDGSSPISNTTSTISPSHPINPMPPPFPNPLFGMPAPVFMENMPHPDPRLTMYPPRPSFMPRPAMHLPERPPLPPNINCLNLGQAPPVTVLIPYPVVLPIPLPIPIPLPLSAFLQAQRPTMKTEAKFEEEGPLDFTMNANKGNSPEKSKQEEATFSEHIESTEPEVANELSSPEQTLPKFKITRLANKMAKISPKAKEPSESTRPLRKRRRLVEATEDDSLLPKSRKTVEV